MLKRIRRSVGFLLAFTALAAFILHPNHVSADQECSSSSHCCVCHTVPMGAERPAIEHLSLAFVVYEVTLPLAVRPMGASYSTETPRGPPLA